MRASISISVSPQASATTAPAGSETATPSAAPESMTAACPLEVRCRLLSRCCSWPGALQAKQML